MDHQRQEADEGVRPDAIGQTVIAGRDLDLGLQRGALGDAQQAVDNAVEVGLGQLFQAPEVGDGRCLGRPESGSRKASTIWR